MMTVGELLDILDGLDADMEVRLAFQPRWPFEHSVDMATVCEVEDQERWSEKTIKREVLYIAEGRQIGYLPASARYAIGWGEEPDEDEEDEE